jgi:hypothetical protein
VPKPIQNKTFGSPIGVRVTVPRGTTATTARSTNSRVCAVRASLVDSYESSFNFASRMEKAWLISQVRSFFFLPPVCLGDKINY